MCEHCLGEGFESVLNDVYIGVNLFKQGHGEGPSVLRIIPSATESMLYYITKDLCPFVVYSCRRGTVRTCVGPFLFFVIIIGDL